jgi:plasmid stability protein
MPSLTIKDIPEKLLRRVRARAAADRRSMNGAVIHLLDEALAGRPTRGLDSAEVRAKAQVEAWLRLAGRWRSRRTASQEIAQIYAARSRGRPVRL